MTEFKKIFEPFRLNDTVVFKNRIIEPNASHPTPQGPESWPADPTLAETSEFGLSGVSLICVGHFGRLGGGAVGSRKDDPNTDKSHITIYDFDDPSIGNYLSQEAAIAHMHGSKMTVKIAPKWPKGFTYGGGDYKSLCPIPEGVKAGYTPHAGAKLVTQKDSFSYGGMTLEQQKARIASREQIQEVIQEVVDMCALYKSWGWDGISFRCDRIIDGETNLREDEYGGEIENRGRFCYELFAQVKKACGKDFIITASMCSEQDHGYDFQLRHGYSMEEAVRFLVAGQDVIDIAELREPTAVGHQCSGYDSMPGKHRTVECARALKAAGFTKAVAVNGGFHDPEEWEALLTEGCVDLISAGRPFRADPDLMRKLRSNGAEVPTPCVRCNKCHGTNSGPWLAFCAVNPADGLYDKMSYISRPVQRSKKVAIIGGGPIGMRAAICAAERGHQVTLFEKTDFLGGKMKYAALYQVKWPFENYRKWLVGELDRKGVEVKLNCSPDPDQLKADGFEAVIACTGSVPLRPELEGADADGVLLCSDIYEQKAEAGQKVVIVGGSDVGTETAIHLAQTGRDVTVITRADLLMRKEKRPHGPHASSTLLYPGLDYGCVRAVWDKYDNLKPVYGATTQKVTPNSVTYTDKDGKEITIECDTVIVNGGYKPCIEEAMRYGSCTPEFYLAGDVEADICCNIQQGNRSAFGKANLL